MSQTNCDNFNYFHQEILDELKPDKNVLHWNCRGFVELPIELLHFGQNVEELYLKWNELNTLPDWIDHLNRLVSINVLGNKIILLPESIGCLKLLSVLEIQNNRLVQLPKTIGDLKNLNVLNLQGNQLSFIPSEINNLKALQSLNLCGNRIRNLPRSLCRLTSLQEIILDHNFLTSLPLDIVYLPNLTIISLNGNHLRFLPFEKFISSPVISIVNNPHLNYLSYDVGCLLTSQSQVVIDGSIWHFDLTGCDCENLKTEEITNNIVVSVPSLNKRIILPEILREVSSSCKDFKVAQLYELALRIVHDLCFQIVADGRVCLFPDVVDKLPSTIQQVLQEGPVAKCHFCGISIFAEGLLWIFPRYILNLQDRNPSSILSIVLFCSPRCSGAFTIFENNLDTVKFPFVPWERYNNPS